MITKNRGLVIAYAFLVVLSLIATLTVSPVGTAEAAAPNLIQNASLEEGGSSTGMPKAWHKGGYGDNARVYTYPANGKRGAGARVEITSYTSGDVKWYFEPAVVTSEKYYDFEDYYRSNRQSYVTVQYRYGDGTVTYLDLGTPGASSNWKKFSTRFKIPSGVTSITVFHLIKGVGYLETDSYSLSETSPQPRQFEQGFVSINFDDGWMTSYENAVPILDRANIKATFYITTRHLGYDNFMTKANVMDLYEKGHEIGAHTRTHPHLAGLSRGKIGREIAGSKQDLQNIGIRNVATFAYPFGEYNKATLAVVKSQFKGARVAGGMFSEAITDKYLIRSVSLRTDTSLATVQGLIDRAIHDKTWLILNFHHVRTDAPDAYTVTPDMFEDIVDYLTSKGVPIRTNVQGLGLMGGGR